MPDFIVHPQANTEIPSAAVAEHFQKIAAYKDRVHSGYTIVTSGSALSVSVQPGVAFVAGRQVGNAASVSVSKSLVANATNHVYLKSDGNIEVNQNGVAPANSVKLWECVTNGTGVTSTTDRRVFIVDINSTVRVAALQVGENGVEFAENYLKLKGATPYVRLEDTTGGGVVGRLVSQGGYVKVMNDAMAVDAMVADIVNGRVGVNAAVPYVTLDVNGIARIRGTNALRFGGTGAADHTAELNSPSANLLRTPGALEVVGALISATVGPTSAQQHALPAVASDTVVLVAAPQTLTSKTLTNPRISGIQDLNGVFVLGFTATASAVNNLVVQNAVTGSAPILTVSGSDANIGINFTTKGTGKVQINGKVIDLANSFITAGNFSLTLTTTAATSVTLPTTGTLATLAGIETFTNKTLTDPRISSIKDANGNTILNLPATASAVNYVEFANNVAGSAPQIRARGSDTNINLNLEPKGTGKVQINGQSIDLAGSFTTSGVFSTTITVTAATSVTLPTSGTLATLGNTETFTGVKTFNPSSGTVPFVVGAGKTSVVTLLNADQVDGKDAADFLWKSGGVMTGDIEFAITVSTASKGIKWNGVTDTHHIFVEEYGGSETTRLVIYSSDNGDSDHVVFRNHNTTSVDVLTIKRTVIDASVKIATSSFFESTVATGTAPLVVASTTKVANLNADLLDGLDSAAFMRSDGNTTTTGSVTAAAFNVALAGAVIVSLSADANGGIEVGRQSASAPGAGTTRAPFIDFHFETPSVFNQDYNIRIQNKADKTLDVMAPGGGAILQVQGVTVVTTARSIASGTGISGGGDLSADRTLSIDQSFTPTWTGLHTHRGTDSFVVLKSENSSASNAEQFSLYHSAANVGIKNARGNVVVVANTQSYTFQTDGIFATPGAVVLGAQATGTTHAVRADRNVAAGTGLSGGGNLTADRTLSVDQSFAPTWTGQHIFAMGSDAVRLRASATYDHVYMGFYARTATPTTRSGFIGYGSNATLHLSIYNEIANGDIVLTTTGTGQVKVGTNAVWHAGNFNKADYVTLTGAENLTNKTFSATQGTAPFSVVSTTAVSNLNADLLDGLHAAAFLRADATSTLTDALIIGTGGVIYGGKTGATATVWAFSSAYTAHGLFYKDAGTDEFIVNANGGVSGDLVVFGNGNVTARTKFAAPTLEATVSTGTAPLVVSSTTMVSNLNAQYLGGVDSAGYARVTRRTYTMPAGFSGWVRVAQQGGLTNNAASGVGTGNRATGEFSVVDQNSGQHGSLRFIASAMHGANNQISLLHRAFYSSPVVRKIRVIDHGTYDGSAVELYVVNTDAGVAKSFDVVLSDNDVSSGWTMAADGTLADVTTLPTGFNEGAKLNLDTHDMVFGTVAMNGTAGPVSDDFYVTRAGDVVGRTVKAAVADGTAPFVVTSTTLVTNLNADTVDGQHASTFVYRTGSTSTGIQQFEGGAIFRANSGATAVWINQGTAAGELLIGGTGALMPTTAPLKISGNTVTLADVVATSFALGDTRILSAAALSGSGTDSVMRNVQGTIWQEIRTLDGSSTVSGFVVRVSTDSGSNWSDIIKATNDTLTWKGVDILTTSRVGTLTATLTMDADMFIKNGRALVFYSTTPETSNFAIKNDGEDFVLYEPEDTGREWLRIKDTGEAGGANELTAMLLYGKKVWYEGNDGPGSGLDADTLDGFENTAFAVVRPSVADSALDTTTTTGIYRTTYAGSSRGMMVWNVGGSLNVFQMEANWNGELRFRNYTDGTAWNAWKTVWTNANFAPSDYLRSNADATYNGDLTLRTGKKVKISDGTNSQDFITMLTGIASGHGVYMQTAGYMGIGGGESASVAYTGLATTADAELMVITNDGNVDVYANLQGGWAGRKHFQFNTDGKFYIGGVEASVVGHAHSGTDITTGTVADARLSANVVLAASTHTLTNKTLTAPRIGAIYGETNNVKVVEFGDVLSAVNYLTVSNAITGGPITLAANGADANVSMNLMPKGTGDVHINGRIIKLGGHLTTSGNFTTTITVTAATSVTLPTTGTLATTGEIETFTNKTLAGFTLSGNVVLSGTRDFGTTGARLNALYAGTVDILTAFKYAAGAGVGKVLTSDASGNASWGNVPNPGMGFSQVTANATMVVNTGYIANHATAATRLVLTLPATASVGDRLYAAGSANTGGWKIAQAAGQRIHYLSASSTAGTGGYIESQHNRDAVYLVCVVGGASSEWQVVGGVGNITVI